MAYRLFMISFTLIFYMAFGCGLYAQFTSFGRIFYTKDMSFPLWFYLSFIIIIFISTIIFLVVSSVKKAFVKGWISFYFVFMNLFFFLLFSLNAYLFVGFILTKNGYDTPFSLLLFVFDIPLLISYCHFYLFFVRNVKEALFAKRKAFLENGHTSKAVINADSGIELGKRREKENERNFALFLSFSFALAILTYLLGLYPQVISYQAIFSFAKGVEKVSIFLAIVSGFIIVTILILQLVLSKRVVEKRRFLYFLFLNLILATLFLAIPHVFPEMIIAKDNEFKLPNNPIGIALHASFGIAALFLNGAFLKKFIKDCKAK